MNRFNCLTSQNDWMMILFLQKQAIINENKRFVCKLLFFESITIISFFARNNLIFLHDLVNFSEKNRYCNEYWWDDLLREYINNVFCVLFWCEMWFKKYDTSFFMQKLFVTIRFRNLTWSFHHQCFDCLISIQRMTYARFRLVEQRICFWWNDSNDCISSNWERFIIWKRFKNDSDNRISLNCERFIKFDESDSSSLMKTICERCWTRFHQIWEK
jgi:hypothetical protein